MKEAGLLGYVYVIICCFFIVSILTGFNCSAELMDVRTWLGVGAILPNILYLTLYFTQCLAVAWAEVDKLTISERNSRFDRCFSVFLVAWLYAGILVYLGLDECDPGLFDYRFKIMM